MLKSKEDKRAAQAMKKQLTSFRQVRGQFSLETDDVVNTQLAGTGYITEFSNMAENDPVCGAVMLALTQIFKSIKWETYNDPKGILKQSLLNVGFVENMADILTMFVFGHSVMEMTLTDRLSDGNVYWDSMYARPQSTISDWKHDQRGKLTHIIQMTDDGEEVPIKAAKCLVFHSSKLQNAPRGKSLFRNAYRDWYYKTNIEKSEAIGVERDLTGLPVLTAPEDVELQDTNGSLNKLGEWAWTTVRNVKRNAQEGLVLPSGWTFQLLGSPGERQFDLNDVINRYSTNIALSMLSQFLVLGVSNSSGSFALAKEQSQLFHMAVEGFAAGIANVVNTQFIGGKALRLFNDLDEQPYLKPVGIERINISDLASFLGRLLKFNIITPDDKLEEFLRDRVALPPRDPDSARIADVKLAYEYANSDEDNDESDASSTAEKVNPDKPDNQLEEDEKPKGDKDE